MDLVEDPRLVITWQGCRLLQYDGPAGAREPQSSMLSRTSTSSNETK